MEVTTMIKGSSMLMDVLAIVIAFSAVMLLLTLVVTSLAHVTQAVLRIRARNLQSSLAAVVKNELQIPKRASRDLTAELLNLPDIAVLNRRKDPTSPIARMLGPFVSWIEQVDLRAAIDTELGNPVPGFRNLGS
jgi:hypothetical protein